MALRARRGQQGAASGSSSDQQHEPTLTEILEAITTSEARMIARLDEVVATTTEALETAQQANAKAEAAQETAEAAQTIAQETRAQLEEMRHQVDFNTMIQLSTPDMTRRAPNIILHSFPVPADSSPATLKQTVFDKFETAIPGLLQADDIREAIKLSATTVKVVFQQQQTREAVWQQKKVLRNLAPANKRLLVSEDLTRARQTHSQLMLPVLQYLNKTIPPAAVWLGAFMSGGILKYYIMKDGRREATDHKANWRPDLVELAKEQLHVLAALDQAGQPLPGRHAQLA
jgi:hypothetical protein